MARIDRCLFSSVEEGRNMSEIKAIETYYDGRLFRSRLEARWAVFFKTLVVEYEYEPEGFFLDNGLKYLPDFRVQCFGLRGRRDAEPFDLYIEVKGLMDEESYAKIILFSKHHPILIVNKIPEPHCSFDWNSLSAGNGMNGFSIYPFNYSTIDGDYFGAYPAAHDGKFYLMGDSMDYIRNDDVPNIEFAYTAARTARFEHKRAKDNFPR
jgi:hypothetical protein